MVRLPGGVRGILVRAQPNPAKVPHHLQLRSCGRYWLSSGHSITRSARNTIERGISIPISRAVLRIEEQMNALVAGYTPVKALKQLVQEGIRHNGGLPRLTAREATGDPCAAIPALRLLQSVSTAQLPVLASPARDAAHDHALLRR
jgi:hypothetical protein